MSEKYISICPKCGSSDVINDFSNPGAVATGLFNNTKKCNHCGNVGMFPEVSESNRPETPIPIEDVEDRDFSQNIYGHSFEKFWKLTGPIMLIGSLLSLLADYPQNVINGLVLIPAALFFTVYAYTRSQFEKYPKLKIIGIILMLWVFIGPLVLY